SVCGVVAGDGSEEIVRTVWGYGFVHLLRIEAGLREVTVEEARDKLVRDDRRDGRPADVDLAATVRRCPDDRVRGNLGLVDRRHGLRMTREPVPAPLELGCVQRGQLHHAYPH